MCNDVSLAFAVSCRNSKVFEMKKNLPLEVVHLKRITQNFKTTYFLLLDKHATASGMVTGAL